MPNGNFLLPIEVIFHLHGHAIMGGAISSGKAEPTSRLFCTMRPLLLACILVTLACPVHAQFGVFLRKILIGDTAAPPNYDTAYITTYKQHLTLSAVSSYRIVSFDITDTLQHAVTWSTNNVTQYGAALDFKWLSVEATFSVPALDAADPAYGSTRSRGVGVGFTGRRLWFRGFWNTSAGFYAEQPQALVEGWKNTDPWPYRKDLEAETWMGSLNYALSKKRRFSQVAALTQMERQKRSAGTWVAGASFWLTRLSADSTLVPLTDSLAFAPEAGIVKARRTLLGASIGYSHTFVFWHKAFIHFSLLTGAASSDQVRHLQGDVKLPAERGLSSLTEFKGGLGFNGDRWYTALTTAFYYNSDADDKKVSLGSTYGTVRFAVGYRFGRPNIKGLEKLGL